MLQPKALIIEDNCELAAIITDAFANLNFAATTCDNGISAYNHIENNNFDIVTIDLDIPFAHGYHIIENMRLGCNKNAGIFIITGYIPDAIKDKISLLHVDHIFTKPFDYQKLQDAIKEYAKSIKKIS